MQKPQLRAIGTQHVGADALATDEQPYAVTIENASSIIWTEIQCFYKIRNLDGVIPLVAAGLFPDGVIMTFYLCPCNQLESFAWGVFFNDINGQGLSYQAPDGGGNFTPGDLQQATGRPCSVTFEVTLAGYAP